MKISQHSHRSISQNLTQHSHRSISQNVSQQKASYNYQQISEQLIRQKDLSSSNYNLDILFLVLQIVSINKSNKDNLPNSQNQVSTRQNITSLPISRLYINNKSCLYCKFVVYSNMYPNMVGFVQLAPQMVSEVPVQIVSTILIFLFLNKLILSFKFLTSFNCKKNSKPFFFVYL